MIEFGSFWAYYSLWFSRFVKDGKNICCEPDPHNLSVGERNAVLNNRTLTFMQAAAGPSDKQKINIPLDSDSTKTIEVITRTVDSIVKEKAVEYLELLHLDVQGFELEALKGTLETIKTKKIRFVCVSTHHYSFSRNPNTHNECINFIKNNGGHVITSHTIPESFSGDGLVVASFEKMDKDFKVATSINHTDASLFRPYEEDLVLLAELYSQK
jgi:FkbM family methyltransferase